METLLYTDFDFFLSSVQMAATLTETVPIAGEGSLQIARVSGTGIVTCNGVPKVGHPQGLTRGQLHVLVKVMNHSGSLSQQYGLCCMQSQRDLRTGGVAYGARFRGVNIDLIKMNSGTSLASMTNLVTAPNLVNIGELCIMELNWELDLVRLGGLYLTVWFGMGQEPNMQQVLTYLDLSAPLTTSVSEGLWVAENFGGALSIVMDDLTLRGP